MLSMSGIDLIRFMRSLRGVSFYLRDFIRIKKQQKASSILFPMQGLWPCLSDKFAEGGSASGQYFHQDLLVAKKIFDNKPITHVDVGSRIDGFVAHVASFRKIEIFDIRFVTNYIHNIKFVQCNMMGEIDKSFVDYCDSLSCLHALEHFGLGRYGDPIKYDGYLDGLNNFSKILKKGGIFYLSVPIGTQRIEFNAHRVFSIDYLISILDDRFELVNLSYIDDHGDLHENAQISTGIKDNFGCNFGCAVFELKKK